MSTEIDQRWREFLESLFTGWTPLSKGTIFNQVILAATNFFVLDLAPTNPPCIFRIYACFSNAGILSVARTRGGVTTVNEQFNAGANLAANGAYMFDIIVESGETINLRYSVGCNVRSVKVLEVGRMN